MKLGCSRCRYSKRGCDRCRTSSEAQRDEAAEAAEAEQTSVTDTSSVLGKRSAACRSPPPKRIHTDENAVPQLLEEIRKPSPDMEILYEHLLALVAEEFGLVLGAFFVYDQALALARMYTKALQVNRSELSLPKIEIRLEYRVAKAMCADIFGCDFSQDDVQNVLSYMLDRMTIPFDSGMTIQQCRKECDDLTKSSFFESAVRDKCPGNLTLPRGHAFRRQVADALYELRMMRTALPHGVANRVLRCE